MKRQLEDAYEQHLEYLLRGAKSKYAQPWERSQILNPPSILPGLPVHQRWGIGAPAASGVPDVAVIPSSQPSLPSVPFAQSKGVPWQEKQSESRSAAVAKWCGIVSSYGEHFGVMERVTKDIAEGQGRELSSVLLDIFALKARRIAFAFTLQVL